MIIQGNSVGCIRTVPEQAPEVTREKPKAGFIYPLAGAVVPQGFLLCDGGEYSRAEYPELFAAIGTMYGSGDGSLTFHVPNLNMPPYTVVSYIIATGKDTGVSVADIILGAQAIPLGLEYGGVGATDPRTARENLGITPENIGAMSMKLLWVNASPTSDFAPQSIALDLAPTDKVLVQFTSWKGFTAGSICSMSEIGRDAYGWFFDNPTVTGTFTAWFRAWRATNSGVTFENGWTKILNANGSAGAGSGYMIPVKIYRIRGAVE